MKKICNLSRQHRDFFIKIEEITDKDFINAVLIKKKSELNKEEIYINFHKINSILLEKQIDIYDINNILQYYCRDHKMVNFIRKLIFYKNRFILLDAISSKKWKACVRNLITTCNKQFGDKCHYREVESSLLNVLKKNMSNWAGNWSIIDFNKENTIDTINIIDSSDMNQLLRYMIKDHNKKTENKTLLNKEDM